MFKQQTPRHLRSVLVSRVAMTMFLGTCFVPGLVFAAENLRSALHQALANPSATFMKPAMTAADEAAAGTSSRRWLGGMPTLSVIYLDSNRSLGTDETELSLSFPIKSSLQRRSDARLDSVDPALKLASQRYRSWYLSGSLRELFARERIASASLPAAVAASTLLIDMESQLQARLAAGSAERFDLIAVQRQRLDADGKLAALRAEIAGVSRMFAALTGEGSLPKAAGDDAVIPPQPLYGQHPRLELLDLNQEQQLASLRATSSNAVPWNVAVIGRELSLESFTEHQIGIAIDVPISLGAKPGAALLSSERALLRDFQIQRDEILLQLQREWTRLHTERERLLSRKALLLNAADAEALATMIAQTRNSLELPIELRLQRMLALLDAQVEPKLLAAQIDANSAALRQLAGMGL